MKRVAFSIIVAGALVAFAGGYAFAGAPETEIDCGIWRIFLTTGTQLRTTLEKLPDGSYLLYDTAGNEAHGDCGKAVGCLGIKYKGGCHINRANQPYAETDVHCPNGDNFTITTGNENGTCTISTTPEGDVRGGTCDDGNGNSASVNCSLNGGDGACSGSSGSGDCSSAG